jgi:predicted lipoprotein with Yx(FWY)xxD motif
MTRPTIIRPTTGRGNTRRNVLTVTVLAGAGLALAACGSSASTGQQGGTTNAAASSGSGIHVAKTSLGKVLVDSNGFSVYTFTSDSMNKSTCDAACLHFWPAVSPSNAKAAGVMGKLGQTQDTTGSPIATVNGMPLYTYSGDHNPGDVLGQNSNKFGGHWYVVSPAGQPIMSSGGSSGGGGGGGYSGGGGGGGGGGGYSY